MIEKYLCNDGILHVTTTGTVSLNGMFSAIEFIANDTSLPDNLKILVDASNSIAIFKLSDIEAIMNKARHSLLRYKSIHHAIILLNPVITAYAIIAKKMTIHNYQLEVFSTEQAARMWLNLFCMRINKES